MGAIVTNAEEQNKKVPAGYLYYSKQQRKELSAKGTPLFFGELIYKSGATKIVEYTEMIDFQTAQSEPDRGPWEYEDIICLGKGIFHHSEES